VRERVSERERERPPLDTITRKNITLARDIDMPCTISIENNTHTTTIKYPTQINMIKNHPITHYNKYDILEEYRVTDEIQDMKEDETLEPPKIGDVGHNKRKKPRKEQTKKRETKKIYVYKGKRYKRKIRHILSERTRL
jgi:hypothetical protein